MRNKSRRSGFSDDLDKVREERIKLAASFLNISAAGATINGIFLPVFNLATRADKVDGFTLSGAVLISIAGAAILDFAAQLVLGLLEP